MWWMVALAALAGGAGGSGGGAGGGACGVAELACRSGRCVAPDAYCDGRQQCGDGSDEPAGCSPCNRTYYGQVGRGYELALGAAPRLPFLCHLTFTAGGGALGDLLQLGFEQFRVGRYAGPGGADGECPDGYVQLAELGRPFTGGSWCGEAGGPALYYSETATVTLSLRLYRQTAARPLALRLRYRYLSARSAVVRLGGAGVAGVAGGAGGAGGEATLERGAVAPGTYCTRTFDECHRRACRVQSPNYPGLYPRNVTCYWALRQRAVPACKHAMIQVRQDHAHKVQIKRSIQMASVNKTGRAVAAWRACTPERDRLIVYDGGSTDDPVLLTYCGGDWLPPVTSRGPDMLLAFHSSPYSAPPRAAPPLAPLRGFELDVAVVFADSDSLEYAREPRRCEFHVKASSPGDEEAEVAGAAGGAGGAGGARGERGRRGVIHAPRHTLPPNTTCTWTFHGRPGDVVWIYFASYTQYSLVEPRREAPPERDEEPPDPDLPLMERGAPTGDAGGGAAGTSDASPWARLRSLLRPARPPAAPASTAPPAPRACATSLRVWDGGGEGEPGALLLGRYCDAAPALCARAALAPASRAPRACAPPDGYVSRGALLSLAASSLPGTAIHPLRFSLHYEFVDARLPGAALAGRHAVPAACAREVTAEGAVGSPRNVLWLGRGGARRLRCVTRLAGGAGGAGGTGARVELTLTQLSFGATPRCSTRQDARTGRLACVPDDATDDEPDDVPDDGDVDDDHDFDDETHQDPEAEKPLRAPHLWIYESPWPGYRVPLGCVCDNSSVGLVVGGQGALELELVARALSPREDARHVHWGGTWRRAPPRPAPRAPPPGGPLLLSSPSPVLLAARGNRSVFVRVWGEELPPAPPGAAHEPPACAVAARLLVYDANTNRLLKVVCPGATHEQARTVQVFSPEWWGGGARGRGARGAALVLAWGGEAGAARAAWLEVWRGGAALRAVLLARLPDADNVSLAAAAAAARCEHACPELEACADAALWCSGWAECPRGGDEAGCGAARLLAALGGWRAAGAAGGAAGAACALLLLLLLALRRRWARGPHKGALPPRRATREPLLDARPDSAAS